MRIVFPGLFLGLVFGIGMTASAQVSPFVEAQIQSAVTPCSEHMAKLINLSDEAAKPVAEAGLPICYDALNTLDAFETANAAGLNRDETAYLYYMGGNAIWLTAAGETLKNDRQLTSNICMQVAAAESVWVKVQAEEGSLYDQKMRENQIRNILLPICMKASEASKSEPAPATP